MVRWVAAIADKVKNPIAGVSSTLQMIEQELYNVEASPQATKQNVLSHIGKIHTRLGKLSAYIDELMRFSDPVSLTPGESKAQDLVNMAIQAWRDELGRDMAIDLELDLQISRIVCDQSKMVKALAALMANAVESIPADRPPRLRFSVICTARPNGHPGSIAITLEDNGCGFAQLEHPELYLTPFYSTKATGTGLGLSIVQKYVAAHGGSVALERSPDLGGARVTVQLPQ